MIFVFTAHSCSIMVSEFLFVISLYRLPHPVPYDSLCYYSFTPLLSEYRLSGTPEFMKYQDNKVWASLPCDRVYIMISPKSVTYICETLFLDSDLTPVIKFLVYVAPLNRRRLNIAYLVWNLFVRGLVTPQTEFLVVDIMVFLAIYIIIPHICASFLASSLVFGCLYPIPSVLL